MLTRTYIENSLGFGADGKPAPAYAGAVRQDKKYRELDEVAGIRCDVEHVKDALSRSTKLRALRDHKQAMRSGS
jgi:hypothetical protein